jgi:ribosomal protein S18 acetylase RimI-like enzyme
VSELRPDTPVRRPDNVRPREEPVPVVDPPSAEELEAIQRHLVTLPGHEGASVRVDDELGLTFVQGPGSGPDVTYAAIPRWSVDELPDALAATRERMQSDGAWPSLLVCDALDKPPGLGTTLERQGWMRVTSETVMSVGHASVVPHLDPLLRIESVQPRSLPTHEALERGIFGIGADQAERRRTALTQALEAGTLRAWIIWLDQEPIAVARLSQGEGVAGLQGIGVVEGRRGQGYGRLITTVATRAGMAVGNRLLWLSVRDDNRAAVKVYSKLGFKPAFSWTRWLVTEDSRLS